MLNNRQDLLYSGSKKKDDNLVGSFLSMYVVTRK